MFAALLVGALPQIIPELLNPDSLGQFVNGGFAAIIIVLLFLGTVVVSLVASLIYRLVSYKHIWYEFGDEEFSFYSGIFNKKRVHVPYRRIQSVDQTASLLQRVFGVCTVQIDTAGGASNKAVSVPFLRKTDAEALRADPVRSQVGGRRGALSGSRRPSSFGNVLDAPAEVWDDVRGVFAGSEVDTGRISFQYGITNSELILTGLSNSTTLVLVVVGIIGVFSQVADFVSQMAGEAGGAVAEVLADAGLALFGNSLIALIVVGLIALSLFVWVMSALGTCISFGGFKARRRGDRIEVERGLLQHRFHGVSVDRVQSVVVKQTFVRRIFGLLRAGRSGRWMRRVGRVAWRIPFPKACLSCIPSRRSTACPRLSRVSFPSSPICRPSAAVFPRWLFAVRWSDARSSGDGGFGAPWRLRFSTWA